MLLSDSVSFQRSHAHFFQEIFFQVEELLGEVHINLLGIHQTAGFIPESILLFQTVFSQFHNLRRGVDAFSLADNRDQKFAEFIGSSQDFCLFPGIYRVEDDHGLVRIKMLVRQTDQVGFDLAGALAVNTVDGLVAGVVTFSVFSESLIFGVKVALPASLTAASL